MYHSCFCLQSTEHVHTGLPTPPNRGTCLQPNSTFICCPNRFPGETFPGVLSSFQYRLSRTAAIHSTFFKNPDLFFNVQSLFFEKHWSDLRADSAFEAITVWRCRNFILGHNILSVSEKSHVIMRPSSLGARGPHIASHSVCPSVCPSRYHYRASRGAT